VAPSALYRIQAIVLNADQDSLGRDYSSFHIGEGHNRTRERSPASLTLTTSSDKASALTEWSGQEADGPTIAWSGR
jgi:hypothetical protein